MPDPIETYRAEATQRIQLANSQGGWEGIHTDFKVSLGTTPRDLARLLKHILAFGNTPRSTEAYIICGVSENKQNGTFTHVGVSDQGFPSSERLYSLLKEYTDIRDVFIDAHFYLDDRRTPYIVIPLQYEGPCALIKKFQGAASTVIPDEIYCRYGSSSMPAMPRDVRRMHADWATWFLDCRYEKSAAAMVTALSKRFPRHSSLTTTGDYVRLVYESDVSDEFGQRTAPALIHAYWGFAPVPRAAYVAKLPLRVLLRSLPDKRVVQATVPLLSLIAATDSQESIQLAKETLEHLTTHGRNFCDVLRKIKQDKGTWVDSMLLRDLNIKETDLLDSSYYESLFTKMLRMQSVDRKTQQYVDRTIRAIQGEKHRQTARVKQYRSAR